MRLAVIFLLAVLAAGCGMQPREAADTPPAATVSASAAKHHRGKPPVSHAGTAAIVPQRGGDPGVEADPAAPQRTMAEADTPGLPVPPAAAAPEPQETPEDGDGIELPQPSATPTPEETAVPAPEETAIPGPAVHAAPPER